MVILKLTGFTFPTFLEIRNSIPLTMAVIRSDQARSEHIFEAY
jgi:hypothetical protein